MHVNLPILLAATGEIERLTDLFSSDACLRVLAKPFSSATLLEGISTLGGDWAARHESASK